jgi:hypothetical protein
MNVDDADAAQFLWRRQSMLPDGNRDGAAIDFNVEWHAAISFSGYP